MRLRRSTLAPLALGLALAASLAGCAGGSPSAPTASTDAVAATPEPVAAETPTSSGDAAVSPSTAASTAASATLQLPRITSTADCEAYIGSINATTAVTAETVPLQQTFPVGQLLTRAGADTEPACRFTDPATYKNSYTLHFGTTPDGSPVDVSAFVIFPGASEGMSFPEEYESDPEGAGTMYFVDGVCGEGPRCGVCHYVEGSSVVTHVRPQDGECRTTLRALIATLRP